MPLITLGDNNQLVLKIPSKGDLNWSDNFKTQFAQKIVEHDHTGIDGKGKQLTGDSLADGSINRASLMAIDLQDLPNVTDTYSDPNDVNTLQYADGDVLKYSRATNTWIPGAEGEIYINISQDAQVESFSPGSFVSVTTINNLSPTTSDPDSQYWLDFTSQPSLKGIFLTINLTNPTTQKVILPSMEACTIVSNVDVDLEGDLINCDITVRREGGFCTTTMGSTAKMEGCEGDFDKLISGSHTGSDLSRFIQSTITADELQAQLTDNNSNTLVIDQSEVIIDLLSNSASLSTSSEYLKLQNKAQVTVKQFDATFPIDATRVNLADVNCLLLSRGVTNNLTAWNGTRFNHLASPSNINKFITADSSGDPVDFNVPVGSVPVARSGGFSTEEYKLVNLDDVSVNDSNTSSNYTQALGKDPSDNIIKKLEYLDCTVLNANSLTTSSTTHSASGVNSTSTINLATTSNYSNAAATRVSSNGITWVSGRELRLNFNVSSSSGSATQQLLIEEASNGSNNAGVMYAKYKSGTIYHYKLTDIAYAPSASSGTILDFSSYSNGRIQRYGTSTTSIQYIGYQSNTSDYRLKENIAPIENASSLIMSLKPCKYNFKEDNRLETGFIAHELAEVLPEFVTGEKDAVDEEGNIQAQSVEYGRMTGVLTAALQEALVKIDSLEARIKELEDKE